MEIRALIIDDEPLARNVILEYSKRINNLTIVEACEDAVQAIEILGNTNIDLLFLDINMPMLSGISFLKTLKNPPLVIFTTAYAEYALESYELNATDYLKKPFSFERFLKAMNKACEQLSLMQAQNKQESTLNKAAPDGYVFIKANKKTYKVNFKDILYVEGLGDYIKIQLRGQHIVTNLTMKKMYDILPSDCFYRIHKSFIISLDNIETIEGNMVQVNKVKLPVGNSYRQDFFQIINKWFPG